MQQQIDALKEKLEKHIEVDLEQNASISTQLVQLNSTLSKVESDLDKFLNTPINGYPGGVVGALTGISQSVEAAHDRKVFFISLKKLSKTNPLIYKSIVWTQRLALTLFLLLLFNALLHPLGWEVNFKQSIKDSGVKVQQIDTTKVNK